MSIRKITDVQCSDGTRINGSDLEKLMDDFVTRFNKIKRRDLKHRFTQTQFIAGYLPDVNNAIEIPFLPSLNSALTTEASSPSAGYDNANRFKGIYQSDLMTYKHVWTISQYFKDPVILVDVTMFLTTDRDGTKVYDNTIKYSGTGTPAAIRGAFVNDIDMIVTTDSVFQPENRQMNSIDLLRHNFSVEGYFFSQLAPVAGYSDMTLTHPKGAPGGLCLRAKELNIPIHRDARVRWSLAIPKWKDDYAPYSTTPIDEAIYGICVTFLEPIKE